MSVKLYFIEGIHSNNDADDRQADVVMPLQCDEQFPVNMGVKTNPEKVYYA